MRIIDWSSDVCFSDLTVTPLHNGEQAYPRMLAAIAAARETIWLGTYIFDNDAVGQQFVAALSQAKSRGVQVKVLIDDTGERYSRSEEHTSELRSLMRISYAVFCLKKKNNHKHEHHRHHQTQQS